MQYFKGKSDFKNRYNGAGWDVSCLLVVNVNEYLSQVGTNI